MAAPSLSLSPVAPVPFCRSLPARSTRFNRDVLSVALPAAASTWKARHIRSFVIHSKVITRDAYHLLLFGQVLFGRWYEPGN